MRLLERRFAPPQPRLRAALGALAAAALVAACSRTGVDPADYGGAVVDGGLSPGCATGEELCGTTCVRLASDPGNCGFCGNRCSNRETCLDGNCVPGGKCPSCPPGTSCSNGQCVAPSCPPCPFGTTCVNGQCIPPPCPPCPTGAVCFNGQCISQGCPPCPPGATCVGGICAMCAPWETPCNGACVDLSLDPQNCGKCGLSCPTGACQGGICSAIQCAPWETFCNGACVDLSLDAQNCGICGLACPAGATCQGGGCVCPGALIDCGGGACVDLATDPSNCGFCGNLCNGPCSNGQCQLQCAAGRTDCSGRCVNLNRNSFNCGACGNVCPQGTNCFAGRCF